MPDRLHLELDALSDFLVDEAGQRISIDVDQPLKPANQRLMDFLGVEVRVTATAGGVSCLIGGCDWRWDGDGDRSVAIEAHRLAEHDHIPAFKFGVRSDEGRAALDAMDSLFTQRELRGDEPATDEVPKPEEEIEPVTDYKPAPRSWTRESIIEAIRRWASEHDGQPPRSTDWQRAGDYFPSFTTAVERFGSWRSALAEAGFQPKARTGLSSGRQPTPARRSTVKKRSVREPKAREAAVSPPPADVKQPAATGDDAVVRESPGPAVGTEEAGSRTNEYAEWLASKVDVALLTGEMNELERHATECQRKADALRQIVTAVRKLESLEGAVDA